MLFVKNKVRAVFEMVFKRIEDSLFIRIFFFYFLKNLFVIWRVDKFVLVLSVFELVEEVFLFKICVWLLRFEIDRDKFVIVLKSGLIVVILILILFVKILILVSNLLVWCKVIFIFEVKVLIVFFVLLIICLSFCIVMIKYIKNIIKVRVIRIYVIFNI